MVGRLHVGGVLVVACIGVLAAPTLAVAQEGLSGTTVRAGLNGTPVSAEPGSGADGDPRLMGPFNCQTMKRLDRTAPDCVATAVNGEVLAGYFGIPVASTVGFAAGDEVIVAGMNGATVDHHEFATIAAVFGNNLILANPVSQSYTAASVAAVAWTNQTGVSVVSDGLQNATCQQTWACGAVSSQAIASGGGYVEFTVIDATSILVAGLGLGNSHASWEDVDFAFIVGGAGGVSVAESGVARGFVGKYGAGDTFRVGVEGGVVTYRHNGRVVYRSTIAPSYPLVFDTSFYSTGARMVNPRLATGANASQVIRVPNYSTLGLGTKVRWAHAPAALVVDGNDLLAGSGCTGWACGATSESFIQSGDGFVEFTTTENTKYKLVGLGKEGPVTTFAHAQFGLVLTDQGSVFQYLYGTATWPSSLTTYVPGDVFRISIEDGAPLFRKNGTVIAGWNVGPDYPLRVVANFAAQGATVTSVTMVAPAAASAPLAPGWSSVAAGVSTTADSLTAGVPCGGWTCGAVSQSALVSGSGYVEFSTAETSYYKLAGLGDPGPITGTARVAYGIMLTPGGAVYIFERGAMIGGFYAYYSPGDRFSVAIEGGQVIYRQNGVALYISLTPPTYPLYFTATFHEGPATLTNIQMVSTTAASGLGWSTADSRITISSNNLTAGTGCAGWACGAASDATLGVTSGYVQFSTTETTHYKLAGLGDAGPVNGTGRVAYGVLLNPGGAVYVWERGVGTGVVYGSFNPGDVFRVGIEGGYVVYRKNGTAFYTSPTRPTSTLHFVTAFYSPGATITNVTMSSMWTATPLAAGWSHLNAGIVATTTNLTARVCTYWECGAVSQMALTSGDGYVEFSTNEINRYKLVGFTNATIVDGWSDVGHGFMLNDGGGLYLWEQGVMVFNGGYYEAGDRFRVGVENGKVVYRRNGNLLYVSNTAPAYPLRFGADFYHAGATVTGVQMSLNGISGWAKSSPGVVMSSTGAAAGGACGTWSCDAMSDLALQDGDGHVEFRAGETNRTKEAGLGVWSGTAPQVAFGLRLSDQGVVEVYENGVKVTAAPTGQYTVGDVFRIGVENGQVKYRKNGTVIYTSAGAPVYPARFIARMGSSGATVSAARLASTTTLTASAWDGITGGAFAVRVSNALSADPSSIYLGNVRPLEQLSTNEVDNGSFEEGFAVVNDNNGAGAVGSFWAHTAATTFKASFAQATRESGLQQHISGGLAGNGITQAVALQPGQSYLLRAVVTVQAGAAGLHIAGQDGSAAQAVYACGPGPERLLSLIYRPTIAGGMSVVRILGSQPNSKFFVDDVQLAPTTLTSVSPGGSTQACTTPPPACVTGMSPGPSSFSKEGGWATFGVVAEPGCVWRQESADQTWLVAVSEYGVGSASVVYSVLPNATPWERSARISIWGSGYDVTQAAGPCATCPAWPQDPTPPGGPTSCCGTPGGGTGGGGGGTTFDPWDVMLKDSNYTYNPTANIISGVSSAYYFGEMEGYSEPDESCDFCVLYRYVDRVRVRVWTFRPDGVADSGWQNTGDYFQRFVQLATIPPFSPTQRGVWTFFSEYFILREWYDSDNYKDDSMTEELYRGSRIDYVQATNAPGLTLFLDADGDFETNPCSDDRPSACNGDRSYVPGSVFSTGVSETPNLGAVPPLSQNVRIIAAYTNAQGQIIPPPAGAGQTVNFSLFGTTRYPGYAMNAGEPASSPAAEPEDFSLATQSASWSNNLAIVTLRAHDYGGFTRVVAANPLHSIGIAVPAGGDRTNGLPLNGWDAYERVFDQGAQDFQEVLRAHVPGDGPAGADTDQIPTSRVAGDGFTSFEEYRGFVVQGRHRRLDPGTKDVFRWAYTTNLAYGDGLNVRWHNVQLSEIRSDRVVNFNRGLQGGHLDQQAVLVFDAALPNSPAPPLAGLVPCLVDQTYNCYPNRIGSYNAPSGFNNFQPVNNVQIDDADIRAVTGANPSFAVGIVIGHELGHALGIEHNLADSLSIMTPVPLDESPWSTLFTTVDRQKIRLK